MSIQKKRIVILVSGSGTNAQAIIEACQLKQIHGEVVALISNKADAYALKRAALLNVASEVVAHTDYASRESFDQQLSLHIDKYTPDLIVLAGFMRILSEAFVTKYLGKMLNIHPSLLPLYPGLNTHQRAIDNGDLHHGASVHYVTNELDGGPVVIQSKVNIAPSDNADSLAAKVAKTEWLIYPKAIALFCENRLNFCKQNVILDGKELPGCGLIDDFTC